MKKNEKKSFSYINVYAFELWTTLRPEAITYQWMERVN